MARADREFYMLLANYEGLINDDKVMLLYDVNCSKNLNLPFRNYDRLSSDSMENDKYIEFRFEKEDLFLIHDILQLPDRITCCYGIDMFIRVDTISGVLVLILKKICLFVPISEHDIKIWKASTRTLHNKQLHSELYLRPMELLNTTNQAWLFTNRLQLFVDAIYAKGAPLDNCCRFIDGTVRSRCRPSINKNNCL